MRVEKSVVCLQDIKDAVLLKHRQAAARRFMWPQCFPLFLRIRSSVVREMLMSVAIVSMTRALAIRHSVLRDIGGCGLS